MSSPDDKPGLLRDQNISIINQDTSDLPYYILMVGRPDQIPFEYQYQLDRIRALWRFDLGDDPAPYRAYVDMVLACEKQPPVAKRALFAAARTDGDEMIDDPRSSGEPRRMRIAAS